MIMERGIQNIVKMLLPPSMIKNWQHTNHIQQLMVVNI